MRSHVLTAAAAVAAATVATPSLAQQVAGPMTGPRVEVLAGYDNLGLNTDGHTDSRDGFTYGGAIGYDVQMGRAVIGAEAELQDSNAKLNRTGAFTAGDAFRVNTGRDLYIGGRIGTVVAPGTLVYAKAGYTNARVRTDYAVGTALFDNKENLDGYRVGAGVEHQMGNRTYVKAEYRYSHYGDFDGYDANLSRNQVIAGVGVRF